MAALLLAPALAHGQSATTPMQWIDGLGVEIRQRLEKPTPAGTPEDAEKAVAERITELVRGSPGTPSLTEADSAGRTPLMRAAADAYPLIVKALLADPGVQRNINAANADGETAWMLAQFAPSVTLAACQPGALTLERFPLLPPYLRRMAVLVGAPKSPTAAISQALLDAGATADPALAKQAWLARCPNAAPELRQALAQGELLPTLVNHALSRQAAFNKAYREGSASLAEKPPAGMRFLREAGDIQGAQSLNCTRRPAPELRGALNWSGRITLKVVAATRAGVVEVADITLAAGAAEPHVVDHFKGAILRALALYECEGEHVFRQELQFKVE